MDGPLPKLSHTLWGILQLREQTLPNFDHLPVDIDVHDLPPRVDNCGNFTPFDHMTKSGCSTHHLPKYLFMSI